MLTSQQPWVQPAGQPQERADALGADQNSIICITFSKLTIDDKIINLSISN